jgi:hypothetical protein
VNKYMGRGIALGAGIGCALGIALKNPGAGVAVGAGLGVALAVVWARVRREK